MTSRDRRRRFSPVVRLGLWLLFLVAPVAQLAAEPSQSDGVSAARAFEGAWWGLAVIDPGRFELDLRLEVVVENGEPRAYFSLPTREIHRWPLDDLVIETGYISFVYIDADGNQAVFSGTLDATGEEIAGTFGETGSVYPTRFERLAGGAEELEPPEVSVLGWAGEELRSRFNADRGKIRVLAILSPSCHSCRVGLRAVERHIFEQLEGEGLQGYAVWQEIELADTRDEAREAASLVRESRISHFWSPSRFTERSFVHHFGEDVHTGWDVFLVFAPDAVWIEEPPQPVIAMHDRRELPAELRLDAAKLKSRIEELRAER